MGGLNGRLNGAHGIIFFPSSQLSPSVLVHVNVHCCTFGGLLPKKEQAHGNEDGLSFGGGGWKSSFLEGDEKTSKLEDRSSFSEHIKYQEI